MTQQVLSLRAGALTAITLTDAPIREEMLTDLSPGVTCARPGTSNQLLH